MSCTAVITPLTCADGVSHPITALGCCGTETPTITQFIVPPPPFFVIESQAVGSTRFNPVIVMPPPGGEASFTGMVEEDEPFTITPFDVLGQPPFDASGLVLTNPVRAGDVEVAPPNGGTTGSTGGNYRWYVIVDS